MPAISVVFSKTPTLLLLARTFSRPPSARTIPYSPSLHIANELLTEALPLSLSLPPSRCLPQLYYVAWYFLPSAPCIYSALVSLTWVHSPRWKCFRLLCNHPRSAPGNSQFAWGRRRRTLLAPVVASPQDGLDLSCRLLYRVPCRLRVIPCRVLL